MINQKGYFVFEKLEKFPGIVHGISTKQFGNMSAKSQPLTKALAKRRRFLAALGIDLEQIVVIEQVHGSRVVLVKKKHCGRAGKNETFFKRTDAMITTTPGIYLAIFTADCIPMFFYEPNKKIIGSAHIGWKGTIKKLASKMVKRIEKLGGELDQTQVFIGPSIGPCHYDIDPKKDDRIRQFQRMFSNGKVIIKKKKRYYLDLWKAHEIQLIQAGVKKENISNPRVCTACHKKHFSSYHLEREKTKVVTMSVIGLRG